MKKSLFYMLILLSIVFALTGCLPKTAGQEPPVPVVSFKAYLPENTPDDATIYIIGNYCNWDFGGAKTSDVQTDDEGKKYAEFELQVAEFPLEYKYTVGPDWAYEEVKADGSNLGNRRIESAPEEVVIDTVAKWTAIPIPPIIIDGDFSDWESYSYTTIVDDPDDDSKWGQNNDVNWLGIAADEQYLYIGAQYKASGNGFIIYISKDGDNTGATDMEFGAWSRAIRFDRNVQYFVASWEHQDPQLWQVVNESTKSQLQEGIQKKFVSQGVGYEVKIPLSVLGLESGNKIYFVGCIVGGDGSSSPDTVPNNVYPENWDWNVPISITNMAEFVIP